MRLGHLWAIVPLGSVLLGAGGPATAELISAAEAAKRIGLSDSAVEQVKKGEIVVEDLEASSDKDLSLAIVATIDAPLARVYEYVDAEKIAELSTVTLSRGQIDTSTFSLAAMKLPDEVLEQLVDDPSDTFFMSNAEGKKVEKAAAQGKAAVLAAYQAILSARAKAYWEGGAAAIEPFDEEGRSPKDDLAHANEAARKIVTQPTVLRLLEQVPSKADGAAVHELFWAVQKGRDQAAPVLSHRILYKQDDGQVYIEKRFYSAYDYDALQIVVGVLPVSKDRCALFYTNHTYTAQVAGFGGGAKRSIGRKLMSKELVVEIERTRKALAGGE